MEVVFEINLIPFYWWFILNITQMYLVLVRDYHNYYNMSSKSRKFIFPGILSLLNIVNNIWWRNTKLSSKFVGYLIENVFDFFFLIMTEMKCSSVLRELNALVASYTGVTMHIIKFIKDWSQFLFDSWRNNLNLKHRVAGYARVFTTWLRLFRMNWKT